MRPNDFNGHMPTDTTTELLERAARARVLPADFDPVTHHKLGERWEDYSRRLVELTEAYGTEADVNRIYTNHRWDEIGGRPHRTIHPYPDNATILRDAGEVWRERLTDPIGYLKNERERQADGVPYIMGEVLKEERRVPPFPRHALVDQLDEAVNGLVSAAVEADRAESAPKSSLRAAWEYGPTRALLIGAPVLMVLQTVLYVLLGGE